ncbi:sulfotransferase domain-containing protein [Plantactinospora sp. WMMB782]|uniref:sulfotransferase domain-containing protein n=1 Tax=Plantactinospora sp. WMMB782 TaxID=3404121 RepID=UPI003B9562B5
MRETPVRYRSGDEDSGRWIDFPFRPGDIVISTRSKSGTTWMQMICALLVFQRPELPAPLAGLSPWFDWLGEPRDEVVAALQAQPHRRFVKTHTPLDGIPIDERARYLVVAREPLDMAVSLYHQSGNLDRERVARLTGQPAPTGPPRVRPPVREWLLSWIDHQATPADELDSLPGVLWHLTDAWARRHRANVLLVHYADLSADLSGQMRRIARWLGIEVPEQRWPALVEAAGFTRMRDRAAELAPDRSGVLRSRAAFFRRGGTGAGRELLRPGELAHYRRRLATLGPPDLVAWLHREDADQP